MAIIDFNSSIWSKPWFRRLSPTTKVLFVYLWTNNHKNLTGMYELDFETMQFETGLTKKQIQDTLSILYPKIKYDVNKEIVWVVNHVQHQFMRTPNISPKIIKGIEKCLISLDNHSFVKEFIEKYDTLSIQYTYCSGEGGGEGVKCIGEGKEEIPEKSGKESKQISIQELADGWNEIVATEDGFKKVTKLTEDRRKRIRLRLKTHPESEFWNKVLNKIPRVPFLSGKNDRKWRADFDFLIKNDENALKIYEGKYDAEKR